VDGISHVVFTEGPFSRRRKMDNLKTNSYIISIRKKIRIYPEYLYRVYGILGLIMENTINFVMVAYVFINPCPFSPPLPSY